MHTFSLKPLLAVLCLLLLSFALADDNISEDDVVVEVDVPVVTELAEKAGVEELGDALYDSQEDVHEVITQTTGKKVDHFYIHLCLGKKACIPVDPFRFSN